MFNASEVRSNSKSVLENIQSRKDYEQCLILSKVAKCNQNIFIVHIMNNKDTHTFVVVLGTNPRPGGHSNTSVVHMRDQGFLKHTLSRKNTL